MVKLLCEMFPSGSGGGDRHPQGRQLKRRMDMRGREHKQEAAMLPGAMRTVLKSLTVSLCLYTCHMGNGGILQGKLVPFIMELNLHLAQESEKPNEDLVGGTGTGGEDAIPR